METNELIMIAALMVNITATALIVHRGRLILEQRLTRVETLVNVILKREVTVQTFREAQVQVNSQIANERPLY